MSEEPRPGTGPSGVPDVADEGFSRSADALERRLLGAERLLRRRDVSGAAGVSLLSARRFWRALGFPNVGDVTEAFTESDVAALRSVVQLVREGVLDEETALGLTRAMGRSADRLANWQIQLVAEALAESEAEDPGTNPAERVGELLAEIVERTEPLLTYAWRRHLASAVGRMVADADVDSGRAPGPVRTVGFADLVAFTRVVRRSTERELARLVQRFEAVTSDIVSAHGGRVVKTVGDEVLFVTTSVPSAGGIALDIADAMADDAQLPDVRVGMATGPVVARLGDVFGTTVNRASRLTGVAAPGAVLVDETTAARLDAASGFEVVPQYRRALRGIGSVTPSLVRRSTRRATPGP
ncbi:MAG: adenylate/guanylate cyclase domain-containing protein [Actinomycetes bacterium]